MPSLLERYDRATEDEVKARAKAAMVREYREALLWVLHRDGATLRQIESWTNLSHGKVRRMVAAGRVRYEREMGES